MRRINSLSLCGLLAAVATSLFLFNGQFLKKAHAQANKYQTTVYASYLFHTLKNPTGLAMSAEGITGLPGTPNLLIADTGNHIIRRFDLNSGTLITLAGSGTAGYVNSSLLLAEFNNPTGLDVVAKTATDQTRHYYWNVVYVGDSSNYVARYFCSGNPHGTNSGCPPADEEVYTYAGNHTKGYVNGPPASAEFAHLGGIHASMGYGVDTENHVLRGLGSSITTFAGTGTAGFVNGYRTSAKFNSPTKMTADASNNFYVSDAGNHVIRKIDTSGNVTTFSGSGAIGYANGSPSAAKFVWPTSIVFNFADNYFYVADPINNMIRRIDLSGNVTTYSGATTAGYVNGSLSAARYSNPTDLVIYAGVMYVSDTNNNAIRQIDMSTGIVSTFIN
jgi:serine/threonine-protein kinase